jgi:hypothetical protein
VTLFVRWMRSGIRRAIIMLDMATARLACLVSTTREGSHGLNPPSMAGQTIVRDVPVMTRLTHQDPSMLKDGFRPASQARSDA